MRFKDVHLTDTFKKFDGNTILIEEKLYEIDIFPFLADEPTSRMWIRARRVYDNKMYATEKGLNGFSYDDECVEKALFEIKRRIFDDLQSMGFMRPVESF
jgi:hypothetical protein